MQRSGFLHFIRALKSFSCFKEKAVLLRIQRAFLWPVLLVLGLILGIQPVAAQKYRVKPGDSLWKIAKQHRVSMGDLKAANRLPRDTKLWVGQRLNIPRAGSQSRARKHFSWPAPGKLAQRFKGGKVPNDGVEFKLSAGTKIRAAAAGKVVHMGPHDHYGHLLIVQHGNGMFSIYGHNSLSHLKRGRSLGAGQVLATVGKASRNNTPLHFELRHGVRPVDPLSRLKKQK
ncbi:MAG: hypothetical protein CMH60_06890 [Myxococcales bacterium]|nr:hypothetical protein [Myxococcales bacterium]